MVASTFLASLLASALLFSQTEAATLMGLLKAPGHLSKGAARRDTGWGGRALNLDSRDDGCPVGWAECSYFTCYPLDGSLCCSDGNFCDPGYYCDGGGCCLEGHICSGGAPPASTVEFTTTTSTTRRFTSSTAARTTSTSLEGFPTTTDSETSTFVTFTQPSQSTDLGTVTDFTSIPTATTSLPLAGTEPAEGSSPTGLGSLGSGSGAAPTVSRNVHTGMWVAALVAAVMCLA